MLEVCVDTIAGAEAAIAGGAGRIELCSALSEGGLTPSVGAMQAAARFGVPVYAMIRPRAGSFDFSAAEIAVMIADIGAARRAGLAGVVLGGQATGGRLDTDSLEAMVSAAGPMGKTLHRVIDVVPDPLEALDQAIKLGFERVLTSGQAASADAGQDLIAKMVAQAAGRISVMPGGGLTPDRVGDVLARTGATEAHASCSVPVKAAAASGPFDPAGGLRETSQARVTAMARAIASVVR